MAITSDARPHTAERTGIGLRLPHIAEVVATRPPVGWLEIHPENFLANPHALELLTDLARDYRCCPDPGSRGGPVAGFINDAGEASHSR